MEIFYVFNIATNSMMMCFILKPEQRKMKSHRTWFDIAKSHEEDEQNHDH